MVSDNDDVLKPWRRVLAAATREALGAAHEPLDEPVQVYARCWLTRPQRPTWTVPAVKPDADKLGRALLDGLADGYAYVNDSRVIDLSVSKRYEDERHPAGARIVLVWGEDMVLD